MHVILLYRCTVKNALKMYNNSFNFFTKKILMIFILLHFGAYTVRFNYKTLHLYNMSPHPFGLHGLISSMKISHTPGENNYTAGDRKILWAMAGCHEMKWRARGIFPQIFSVKIPPKYRIIKIRAMTIKICHNRMTQNK